MSDIPTDEQIMAASPAELDAASPAELDVMAAEGPMGWNYSHRFCAWVPPGSNRTMADIVGKKEWHPSTDIAAAMRLEDRIEELGLSTQYAYRLSCLIQHRCHPLQDVTVLWWLLAHASPLDRTRAAVLAWAAQERIK